MSQNKLSTLLYKYVLWFCLIRGFCQIVTRFPTRIWRFCTRWRLLHKPRTVTICCSRDVWNRKWSHWKIFNCSKTLCCGRGGITQTCLFIKKKIGAQKKCILCNIRNKSVNWIPFIYGNGSNFQFMKPEMRLTVQRCYAVVVVASPRLVCLFKKLYELRYTKIHQELNKNMTSSSYYIHYLYLLSLYTSLFRCFSSNHVSHFS